MGSQNGSPVFAPLVAPVSTEFEILGQWGDRPLSLMRRAPPEGLLPYQSIVFHASDPVQLPRMPWLPSDVQGNEGETVPNPRKPPAGLQVSSPDRAPQLCTKATGLNDKELLALRLQGLSSPGRAASTGCPARPLTAHSCTWWGEAISPSQPPSAPPTPPHNFPCCP